MGDVLKGIRFKPSEARATIRKETGNWQFEIRYKNEDGKWRCKREPTGIKASKYAIDAFSEGKKPKPPKEVEALREELTTKLANELNIALFGESEADDSLFMWLEKYRKNRIASIKISDTTKKSDEGRYNGIKSYKKLDKPIANVTAKEIKTFLDSLVKKGLSGNTIQQYKIVLDGVFDLAFKEGAIVTNPMDKIDNYRTGIIHKVTSKEVVAPDKIFEFIALSKDEYLYPCIFLSACMGLRRSELLGLKWSNVHIPGIMGCKSTPGADFGYIEITQKIINCDPDDNEITYTRSESKEVFKVVQELKTNSSRREVVIANKVIMELFKELFNKQQRDREIALESWNSTWGGTPVGSGSNYSDDRRYKSIWENGKQDYGYVCIDALGEIISPGQVDNQWKTLRKKYPDYIGTVKFHGLRHTYATYLVSGQVPIWTVSKMLGHSSVTITDSFYVHAETSAHFDAIKGTAISKEVPEGEEKKSESGLEFYDEESDTYVSFF